MSFISITLGSSGALIRLITQLPSEESIADADFSTDDDPLDSLLEGDELGLLIRTDYSNNAAWDAFCARLREAEADIVAEPEGNADVAMGGSDEEEEGDDGGGPPERPRVFKIVDPTAAEDRALLDGVSNLAALRLFADLAIREAPPRPPGTMRVNPPNRLIDHDGWQ